MLKMEMIGSEMIKPATPTPPNLRFFNLTSQDLFAPPVFIHLILYYPSPTIAASTSSQLKTSLSQSLVRFYPLAGTLEYDAGRVYCNDQGVEFVDTRVAGSRLQDLLQISPDERALNELIPCNHAASKSTGSDTGLLAVQANFFDCGGLALAVSFRHSICDMGAFAAFLNHWATVSSHRPAAYDEAADRVVAYGLHLYTPPANPSLPKFVFPPYHDPAMKRFSFSDASIAALKKNLAGEGNGDDDFDPTRVEVITSLICRCMFRALTTDETMSGKVLIAIHAVNLRRQMNPILADINSFGNMNVPSFTAPLPESELTMNGKLEKELRNSFKKVEENIERRMQGGEYWSK